MHTFFINTSGNELGSYSDIFEIQHETRQLVSLACPLAKWNDDDVGHKACVRKMGELIDNYKGINNNFNLILYIDLLAYEAYTSIPMNKHLERHACLKALRAVLVHYIKETFVKELNECGRAPQEVLLIFEENQLPRDADEQSEGGKEMIRTYTRQFLGLPAEEELDKFVCNTDAGEGEKGEALSCDRLCEEIAGCSCSCLGETVLEAYRNEIETFISEVKGDENSRGYETTKIPLANMLDDVIRRAKDDAETVASVSFVTDRRAGITNKQEKARRDLRLSCYILACIENMTIYDANDRNAEDDRPKVRQFPEVDWKEVAIELSAKSDIFRRKHSETQQLSESFSKMKLAPDLFALDHKRFALDQYGKRAKTLEVVDVEEKKDEEQEAKDIEEGIVRSEGRKAVVVNDVRGRSLFKNEEYQLFDYLGDDFDDSILGAKATAEQYVAEAKKLRLHHLDYLHKLKVHVTERLSNYAGRSAENDPALLRKRKVSVAEEDFDDMGRDYRYRGSEDVETKKLKTVEDISETAYTSAVLDYMEFCAGRSVAVTDIEEQCNWFVTRVHQIKESLKKIKLVALGMLFAIVALYLPFLILQWEAIVANVVTLAVALVSVAIPLALLYVILTVLAFLQRRKFRQAWKEFKEKSDRVLEENALAAEKYDQLLCVYVPTLRWIYEYKLDVAFYADCCKMARAKIAHHIQRLHDRVVMVGNIIEDLEIEPVDRSEISERVRNHTSEKINYNVSFCTGTANRDFYSIIDKHFLKAVHK